MENDPLTAASSRRTSMWTQVKIKSHSHQWTTSEWTLTASVGPGCETAFLETEALRSITDW